MEDIINRGGGDLEIQLWNSTPDEQLASSDVTVSVDGTARHGEGRRHDHPHPGRVRLPARPGCTTSSGGRKGKGTVLVGEVSRVNDDYVDNRFYEPAGRFPTIEEDETPLYLLYDDYKRYYKHA